MLRAWRWVDAEHRTWTALIDYTRDGLTYSHWVHGDLIEVLPQPDDSSEHLEPRISGDGPSLETRDHFLPTPAPCVTGDD